MSALDALKLIYALTSTVLVDTHVNSFSEQLDTRLIGSLR